MGSKCGNSKNLIKLLLVYLVFTQFCISTAFADSNRNGFFDERYRGWLWFEENNDISLRKTPEQQNRMHQANITPVEAKAEIEQFAKELEELKFMMLARPTPENVRAYRDKERAMWEHAEKLHDSWDMANLLYPEQRDLINNPVNVYAVKAKRQIISEKEDEAIKKFAKNFDLVLFFSTSCRYCQLFSPVLKDFAKIYNFNIEAVSSDGAKHEHFRTSYEPELIKRLGISAFPTVIAISRDGKIAFELIRGYVSISELRDYSLLAIRYLEAQTEMGQDSQTEMITSILDR